MLLPVLFPYRMKTNQNSPHGMRWTCARTHTPLHLHPYRARGPSADGFHARDALMSTASHFSLSPAPWGRFYFHAHCTGGVMRASSSPFQSTQVLACGRLQSCVWAPCSPWTPPQAVPPGQPGTGEQPRGDSPWGPEICLASNSDAC